MARRSGATVFGVYLFTTIVGWLFVLFFIFGGGEVDADVDIDPGLGADLDPDVDLDVDTSGWVGVLASVFSFRNLVFFGAFFGLTGLVLRWLDTNAAGTFLAAVAVGGFAAWFNTQLIGYVKRSTGGATIRNRDVEGSLAKVVLPVGPQRAGRVAVDVAGRRLYFVARPYREDAGTFEVGDRVVVIEVAEGTARIAAMERLD